MTKIDYTEQALGLDRPSPGDDLLRVSGASPEQCQGSDHSCISNQSRACFSELFTVFYTIKKKKKKATKCTDLKGLTKGGQKSSVIFDVFHYGCDIFNSSVFLRKLSY